MLTIRRKAFEDHDLIYVGRPGFHGRQLWLAGWHKPSKCLWSDTVEIDGMANIRSIYGEFKLEFSLAIGVMQLNFQMVRDELSKAYGMGYSPDRVKTLFFALNSLIRPGFEPPSAEKLCKSNIFPVKHPDGEVTLCSTATMFIINDRKSYCEKFEKALILYFSLQEVHRIRPLLSWFGFYWRFLSKAVKEVSKVDDETPTPIALTKRDLKRKAYGILR
jgi:hypothetical protein